MKASEAVRSETWEGLLANGMKVQTPEPLVNNAWKEPDSSRDLSIINGDRMNYSAGNQYEKMYAAESSDGRAALDVVGF